MYVVNCSYNTVLQHLEVLCLYTHMDCVFVCSCGIALCKEILVLCAVNMFLYIPNIIFCYQICVRVRVRVTVSYQHG